VIADLKPYADYKVSGLDWLGDIPAHWTVWRVSRFAKVGNGSTPSRAQPRYWNRGIYPWLNSSQVNRGYIDHADQFITPTALRECHLPRVPAGSVLVAITGQGKTRGMSAKLGIEATINQHLAYITPRLPIVSTDYLHLALSAAYPQLRAISDDTGSTKGALTCEDLKRFKLVLPPPDEQAAIVRFLDWANGRLERAIRAKRKVIALLVEQKQVVIQRAVTQGLDPAVARRPTGDPWLGEIPAHWEVWRISRFARVGNGSTPSRAKPSYWNGGTYPWLNSSQVNRGYVDSSDQFITASALRECHLPKVPSGSLLVAITGQGKTRGMSARLGIEATINQHVAYITPRLPVASTDYLHLALTAAYPQLRAISDDSGSTKGALTCEDLKRLKVALPPPREQEDLVVRVRAESRSLSEALDQLEREVDLLREYRTRLVADVVTGKHDVREAAARLPDDGTVGIEAAPDDEADDPELIDEEATEA
jgi:type I restriction enzyme S subunit